VQLLDGGRALGHDELFAANALESTGRRIPMVRLAAVFATLVSLTSSLACCCPGVFNRPIVVQPPQVQVQPPPIEQQKPAKPQPKNPVAAGPRTFDLLPIIDLQWDIKEGKGKWRMQDNKLFCDEGHFVPRVHVPYNPPQEYDFSATFSQTNLRNGVSLIMPKADGGQFYWAVGFSDGNGFGFDADRGGNTPKLIQPNVQYTTTVQVRRDGVKGLLNGKVLVDRKGDYRDLRVDGWREMDNDRLLAIGCDDPTIFYRIWIVEVTGNGKAGR
jgi:hypothetical protein